MSKILLYRASAGSGKTFMLVRQFLRQAFESPAEYRKILAVTFTNKAADEMKERILSELNLLATRTEDSRHLDFLAGHFQQSTDWIRETAYGIQMRMLHDYSRISVGTIDSFFQQVLRAFARESGLPSAYQVEPDNGLILKKFVEYIFNEAASNPDLMNWLVEWVTERTENRESWKNIDRELIRLGDELLKEDVLADFASGSVPPPEPAGISNIRDFCRRTIHDFARVRSRISAEAGSVMQTHALTPEDFPYGKGGPAGFLLKLPDKVDDPGIRAIESLNNPDKWMKKSDPAEKRTRLLAAYPDLNRLANEAIEHYESQKQIYWSCVAVNRNLPALGFSAFLFAFLRRHLAENNTLLLSLSQPMISRIIGDNPSPFIYEKTGTFYRHFLIDEFQDTSDLQWHNFKPLVVDSLSDDGLSMIVGDIKQSLYRWRNSNWRLLHEKVGEDLKSFGSERIGLDTNQRSRKSIIDFNNLVFKDLPDIVAGALLSGESSGSRSLEPEIGSIYSEARQDPGGKAGLEGRVEIRFHDRKDQDRPWKERLAEELPLLVEDLLTRKGYNQNDITFLVRRNSEGDEIIGMLSQSGAYQRAAAVEPWTFVSSDIFRLGNSPVVQMILLALRYLADRTQESYPDLFLLQCRLGRTPETMPPPGFQQDDRALFDSWVESVKYDDLLMTIDKLIRTYELDGRESDLPYIFQFRDQVRGCMGRGISHPGSFISWWDITGMKQLLSADNLGSSMRIMTIHKSKGLSSPVVIIPFCNWDFNHSSQHAPWLWVSTEGTPFDSVSRLPVKYEALLEKSWFAESYRREKSDAFLDGTNLLYVAFTRAIDVMIGFCAYEKTGVRTVADALYQTIGNQLDAEEIYRGGNPGFCKAEEPVTPVPPGAFRIPMISGTLRTTISHRIQPDSEITRFGKMVHVVLESVVGADDLDASISRSLDAGLFTPSEATGIGERVRHLLDLPEVRGWFSGDWEIMNEAVILVPEVGQKRPDRIMIRNNRVVVVDYKTGNEEQAHHRQIQAYLQLLTAMGFEPVEGYLLYLDPGKVVKVTNPEDSSRPDHGHQASLPGFQSIP